MIAVFYYYRFKVSLDDVVELMAMRGLSFDGTNYLETVLGAA